MSALVVGLLSAWVATNQPTALSNLIHQKTGLSVPVPDRSNPVEQEYLRLLAEDDAAQEEVDRWIRVSRDNPSPETPMQQALLQGRIEKRLAVVRQAYEGFLERHPNHARARLAYGSFLNDLDEEDAAQVQWEKARELDPANPAVWNNLANYYGHMARSQSLRLLREGHRAHTPRNPTYYQNLATTVYLFRRQATNHYNLSLTAVLDKAVALYQRALALDPDNFHPCHRSGPDLLRDPPSPDRRSRGRPASGSGPG